MRSFELTASIAGREAAEAFAATGEFTRFPGLAADVETVTRRPGAETLDGHPRTTWRVHFRNGILTWTERDVHDPERLRIDFAQEDGDFLDFAGSWTFTPSERGCTVRFALTFDFGITSLERILDPIAERVTKGIIAEALTGLFGDVEYDDPELARLPA